MCLPDSVLAIKIPDSHRFQQDNDPKHTSYWAQDYFATKNINWLRTPASSPDLNPIELVWRSMKEHLRTYVKTKNMTELKDGIKKLVEITNPRTL